tara:strand:+ start:831 stop:1025 length:195 start_codon:yes stop_codon:yes gene_type:complete
MDLPIDKQEFDEIVDALCNEHYDWDKREFRSNLYQKMKTVQEVMNKYPGGPYKKILREEYGMVA